MLFCVVFIGSCCCTFLCSFYWFMLLYFSVEFLLVHAAVLFYVVFCMSFSFCPFCFVCFSSNCSLFPKNIFPILWTSISTDDRYSNWYTLCFTTLDLFIYPYEYKDIENWSNPFIPILFLCIDDVLPPNNSRLSDCISSIQMSLQ